MDIENKINRIIYQSTSDIVQLQSSGLLINFHDNPGKKILATYIYDLSIRSAEDYNIEFVEAIFLEDDRIVFHMLPETNEVKIIKEKLETLKDKNFTLQMIETFEIESRYFVREFLQNIKELLA